MRTYRDLFRAPEFTPFFVTCSVQVAAMTVSGLALGTLVYAATDSPLLAALSMFGPSFGQLIGAAALLSAADRLPPRAATIGMALFFGVGTGVLAVPGLPIWAVFVIILGEGLVASVGGGVRYGLLSEILAARPTAAKNGGANGANGTGAADGGDGTGGAGRVGAGSGYVLGRSVLNMSVGTMQICGYAVGGALLTALSPRGTLLTGAALYLVTAVVARLGLARRPPRATGRPSAAQTWRINARLWSAGPRRYVYLALWVPNGLIVGCESVFVPYAPRQAGLLFAAAAFGMLAGDTLAGRFVPRWWRERLGPPLRLLLAAPYLIFILHPALPVALAAVALASIGYAASLLLQERLIALTPGDMHGQALGLHSSGMLAWQGIGAAVAGTIAQHTSAATAMTVMAATSVAVTLALAPGLRPNAPSPRPDADAGQVAVPPEPAASD